MTKQSIWIAEHFEELVDKYGGLYVAVVGDRVVVTGEDPKEVEDEAIAKCPGEAPSVLKIPKEEEIVCLL